MIYGGRIVASGDADTIFGSNEPMVHQLLSGELSGPLQLGAR